MDISQRIINPSVETLQEVKIVENQYNAEFGHDIGAVVQYETKSGTNSFHGGVYEYFRNDALDTYNGFTRTKPPDKQHMFGGTVGGPIKKDKLFFFSSLEIHKATTPSSYLLTVPTAAMKQGDFSGLRDSSGNLIPIYDPDTTRTDPATGNIIRDPFPDNIIPSTRFDSAAVLATAYIPDPINSGLTNNLPAASGRTFRKVKGTQKFDWNLTDKDRLLAVWMFDNTLNRDLGIDAYNAIAPQMSPRPGEPGFRFFTQVFNFRVVHTFSPTMFLSTQVALPATSHRTGKRGDRSGGQVGRKAGYQELCRGAFAAGVGWGPWYPGLQFQWLYKSGVWVPAVQGAAHQSI